MSVDNASPTTWLDRRAAASPQQLAIKDGPNEMTFHELAGAATHTADQLTQARVRLSDRVALAAEPSGEVVVACMPCPRSAPS